ncbi:MAG: tRNA lysidine(34) synthetase TilS, partial [Rhodospirillaceae bacterium]|nr:tRNA lysidine(34) synthetase TilS [Rhodospirillaceae bacterium]
MDLTLKGSLPRHRAEPITNLEFAGLMERCPRAASARQLAVGVSGGVDSMALVLLAADWARSRGVNLTALTVDHGLRPEAMAEAAQVAAWLAERDIGHAVLRVRETRPVSGIQEIARDWRFSALEQWRQDHGAESILLAHTRNDQAETLWLRIKADSGPDGLAAMTPEVRIGGLPVSRPLLTVPKIRLAAVCDAHQQAWIEDPSNQDSSFARVRIRYLLPVLEDLGLGAEKMSNFADVMSRLRKAVDNLCGEFLAKHGGVSPYGIAWFRHAAFEKLGAKVQIALIARVVRWIGGGRRYPRIRRTWRLCEALLGGAPQVVRTLGGC